MTSHFRHLSFSRDAHADMSTACPRIRVCGREKAAYIKIRRLGVSISVIAHAFGRSTSIIHRVLKLEQKRGFLTVKDLRKLPNRVRKLALASMERTMFKLLPVWEMWILGEGDKPP